MILNEFKTFIFNGKKSFEDLGIIVTKMPPLPLPKRDISSIQVQGSNRVLHIDNGAYKAFDYTIDCILKDVDKLQEVKNLFKASGQIELSIQPGRIYNCCNVNQIDFENFVNAGLEFPLELEFEPVSYSKEEKQLTLSSSQTFIISGNEKVFPIIEINGLGNITINGISFQILESGITLNCEDQEVYKGAISKNDKIIIDEVPFLIPGENNVTLDSGIEIFIRYHERWL